MKFFGRYRGIALVLLAVGVIAGNSVVFYSNLDRLFDASRWVTHTMNARQAMADILIALTDAETGQRGYLVTSDLRYLAPYHRALGETDRQIGELRRFVAHNEEQSRRMERLESLVAVKLVEMARTVELHQTRGPTAARDHVQLDRGRELMDEIRYVLRDMKAEEAVLLTARQAVYERARLVALGSLGVFVIATLVLLGSLYVVMRRELRERGQAAAANADVAASLDRSLRTLERERNEIVQFNEMIHILQSCNSLDEMGPLSARFLTSMFPEHSGSLWIFAASRNQLVLFATWGDRSGIVEHFAPDECWALRRGQSHHHAPNDDMPVCGHLCDDALVPEAGAAESLCLPLIAHGETFGLLSLRTVTPTGDATLTGADMRRRIDLTVRQLGLTLANLRLRDSLRQQSIRDPLTGAFNRRYLDVVGEKEIAHARRARQPLAVLMLDIDHFKRFNDTHGHSAGDLTLVGVCNLLQEQIREDDWLFRYGGEELVIVLREAGQAEATAKAEKLREKVAELSLHADGRALPRVTISMGIAVFPEHGDAFDDLLTRADDALYASKNAGRNRVTCAESPPALPLAS